VRSVVSRLARLERFNRLSTAPRRLRIQYGYLQTLPDDFAGHRHVVAVRQLLPEPSAYSGDEWFEWEERPGLGPAEVADLNDEQIIQVRYVEECESLKLARLPTELSYRYSHRSEASRVDAGR
jgi:hypothetical protein